MRKMPAVFVLFLFVSVFSFAQQNTPPVPQNFQAEISGANNITLSWTNAGSDIEYEVSYNMQNDVSSLKIIATINKTSYTIPENSSGTYYFWVRSLRKNGQRSNWSSVQMVQITDTAPLVPPPKPPKGKEAVEPKDMGEEYQSGNPWALGASIGTSFAAPLFIGTVHGTYAPFKSSFFKDTFFELGMDLGLGIYRPDIQYFSLYPFVNYALLTPFPRPVGGILYGWYAGAGLGAMFANYKYDVAGPIRDTAIAINFVAGVTIFDMIDVSYTLRTDFKSANNKLSVGYVYRLK